jgi:hypothetical protein
LHGGFKLLETEQPTLQSPAPTPSFTHTFHPNVRLCNYPGNGLLGTTGTTYGWHPSIRDPHLIAWPLDKFTRRSLLSTLILEIDLTSHAKLTGGTRGLRVHNPLSFSTAEKIAVPYLPEYVKRLPTFNSASEQRPTGHAGWFTPEFTNEQFQSVGIRRTTESTVY